MPQEQEILNNKQEVSTLSFADHQLIVKTETKNCLQEAVCTLLYGVFLLQQESLGQKNRAGRRKVPIS